MIRKPNFKLNWKYALGEIALIFIGISLAIAFQNWNETRKSDEKGIQALKDIHQALELDTAYLEALVERLERSSESIRLLLQMPEYDDNVREAYTYFGNAILFEMRMAPFEQLKSTGLDLIKNESLKTSLIYMYDWNYPRTQRLIENDLIFFTDGYFMNFRFEHFNYKYTGEGVGEWIPKNYEGLIKNEDYASVLYRKLRLNESTLNRIETTLEYTSRLMEDISELIRDR